MEEETTLEPNFLLGEKTDVEAVREIYLPRIEGAVKAHVRQQDQFAQRLEKLLEGGEQLRVKGRTIDVTPELLAEALGERRLAQIKKLADELRSLLTGNGVPKKDWRKPAGLDNNPRVVVKEDPRPFASVKGNAAALVQPFTVHKDGHPPQQGILLKGKPAARKAPTKPESES